MISVRLVALLVKLARQGLAIVDAQFEGVIARLFIGSTSPVDPPAAPDNEVQIPLQILATIVVLDVEPEVGLLVRVAGILADRLRQGRTSLGNHRR